MDGGGRFSAEIEPRDIGGSIAASDLSLVFVILDGDKA
jgi:hypothetical protein